MSNEQKWTATNNRAALNKYDALVLKVAASEWVLTESDEYGPQPTHPCLFGCNHPSHGTHDVLADADVLAEVRALARRMRHEAGCAFVQSRIGNGLGHIECDCNKGALTAILDGEATQ